VQNYSFFNTEQIFVVKFILLDDNFIQKTDKSVKTLSKNTSNASQQNIIYLLIITLTF
jgi:hypothetical protein